MIQILFVLAGVYILVKKKINFSKKRELVSPNSIYIGIGLIVLAVLLHSLEFFWVMGLFVLLIITSFFLSRKIEDSSLKAN